MPLNPIVSVTPDAVSKSKGQGALSSLDKSTYDFETTRYPLEGLGADDTPHYVVFNINLPTNSKYSSNSNQVGNVQSASQNNFDMKQSLGGTYQLSSSTAESAGLAGAAVGVISPGTTALGESAKGVGTAVLGSTISVKPKLTRIKKAIAIYMPDTVVSSYNHDWGTASLTEALGKGGQYAALGQGIKNIATTSWDAIKQGNIPAINAPAYNNAQGAEAIGVVADAIGAGKDFTDLALKGQNAAINPLVEMVFRGTNNRDFLFEFDFQPRSSKESTVIQDIIKTFRLYAAPEINKQGNGRYFIPPAQFDIKFFFKNVENDAIAKISTCALYAIDVNYVGSGPFASFDDGQPIHIKLQLRFKEMDIIYRELIDNFGY